MSVMNFITVSFQQGHTQSPGHTQLHNGSGCHFAGVLGYGGRRGLIAWVSNGNWLLKGSNDGGAAAGLVVALMQVPCV